MTPKQIAETLHPNVKALLLRIADGDPYTGEVGWEDAAMEAEVAGLLTCTPPPGMSRPWVDVVAIVGPLTQLGREVADACRPAPWLVSNSDGGWHEVACDAEGQEAILCHHKKTAVRVAALLNTDELAKAKRFTPG